MALQLEAVPNLQLLGRHHRNSAGMMTAPGQNSVGDASDNSPGSGTSPGSVAQPNGGVGKNVTFSQALYSPRVIVLTPSNMTVLWTTANGAAVQTARLFPVTSLSSSGLSDPPRPLGFGSVSGGEQHTAPTTLFGKFS